MKRKEHLIALYFLDKILRRPWFGTQAKNILSWAEDNSIDILGIELDKVFGGRPTPRPRPSDNEQPAFKKTRTCVKELRSIIARKKIPNIFSPDFDPKFTMIADMLGVPKDITRSLLQVLAYNEQYPFLDQMLHDMVLSGHRRDHGAGAELLAAILDCSISRIDGLLMVDGILSKMGLIKIESDRDVDVSGSLVRLMNSKISGAEHAKRILLGPKTRPSLKPRDFCHMESEYNYIGKLLRNAIYKDRRGVNILLYGKPGTGKTEMAKTLCGELGCDLYTLDRPTRPDTDDKNCRLPELMRAQRLLKNDKNSVILMDEAEDVFNLNPFSDRPHSKLYLNRTLENNSRPVIWISNNIRPVDGAYIRRFQYALEVRGPGDADRLVIWQKICRKHKLKLDKGRLLDLSKRYDVAPALIESAVTGAQLTGSADALEKTLNSLQLAMTGRRPAAARNDVKDFNPALLNTDTDLARLAERIRGGACKNFSLCLYGAPGTGKSAYARYLADKIGLKVVQKRASDLFDKYVGETEANIAAAFAEAEAQNAVLVFDEADSFLQSRSGDNKSWEISAVNEMLTQMENAAVPFICTTNLMSSLDKASLRRFTFKVKYDFMTPDQVGAAFRHFFGEAPKVDVRGLTHLAPGDFATVKNKARILGITAQAELAKMLADEMELKGMRRNKIGFVVDAPREIN